MVVPFSLLNSLFSFSFFFGCDGINPREKPWKRGRAPPPQPPQESNNAVYCTYTRLLRPLSYGGRGEMVVRAPHHSKNFFDYLAASGREASVRTFFSCNNERTSDQRACRASYFYDLPLLLFIRFFYTAQRDFFYFTATKSEFFPLSSPLSPSLGRRSERYCMP